MTTHERVQNFRQGLQAQYRRRMEICLPVPLLEARATMAHSRQIRLWKAIEQAAALYLNEARALEAEHHRLQDQAASG